MKLKLVTLSVLWSVLFISCENNHLTDLDEKPGTAYNDVIFGHLNSFIVNPDQLFKLKDNKLYRTSQLPDIDIKNLPDFQPVDASDSLLRAANTLFSSIPAELLSDTARSVGEPFPDVGVTYLQTNTDGKIRYWYLNGTLPTDLASFAEAINKLGDKIRHQ